MLTFKVLFEEDHAEVIRDAVEAARADDVDPGRARRRVVPQLHRLYELNITALLKYH